MTTQSAVVLGTGPSLKNQRDRIIDLKERGQISIFGVNNTFNDFPIDVWIACDPAWHEEYSPVAGDFEKWHWDHDICAKHGYKHIEGRWADGLSLDENYIHYGHSSGYQALGLAVHYGHKKIYLAGYDMKYEGSRHYFSGLSADDGEYPQNLRKYSTFDGLIKCYETIAKQPGVPDIFNMTENSALTCFPFRQP